MTKYQQNLISIALARLSPDDAGFRASPEVTAALESARLYLESWVIPQLRAAIATGAGNDARSVAREIASIQHCRDCVKVAAREAARELGVTDLEARAAMMRYARAERMPVGDIARRLAGLDSYAAAGISYAKLRGYLEAQS